jgi:hypothetical protein
MANLSIQIHPENFKLSRISSFHFYAQHISILTNKLIRVILKKYLFLMSLPSEQIMCYGKAIWQHYVSYYIFTWLPFHNCIICIYYKYCVRNNIEYL